MSIDAAGGTGWYGCVSNTGFFYVTDAEVPESGVVLNTSNSEGFTTYCCDTEPTDDTSSCIGANYSNIGSGITKWEYSTFGDVFNWAASNNAANYESLCGATRYFDLDDGLTATMTFTPTDATYGESCTYFLTSEGGPQVTLITDANNDLASSHLSIEVLEWSTGYDSQTTEGPAGDMAYISLYSGDTADYPTNGYLDA